MPIICKRLDINNLLKRYFDNKLLNDLHKKNKVCMKFSVHNYKDNCIIFGSLIAHACHLSILCQFDNC